MSSEQPSIQAKLIEAREQYRRQHLSDELDAIAKTMEETILQRVLARAFFEEEVEIEPGSKERVQDVLALLEANEYEAVEQRLGSLKHDVDVAATNVENRIQELRLKHNSTVGAMIRLNERVERVDATRLHALDGLLSNWHWKDHVYLDDEDDVEVLKDNAVQYGHEMQSAFNQLKEELFGSYPEEIRDLVYQMIDEERLSYSELTDKQRELLAESDMGEYIELTIS